MSDHRSSWHHALRRRRAIVLAALGFPRPRRAESARSTEHPSVSRAGRSDVPADEPAADAPPEPHPVRVFLLLGSTGPQASVVADALAADDRVAIIGISSDPMQGVDAVADLAPQVVVIDRFVGLTDGLVVARHLHRDVPHAAIIMRTPWPEADRHGAIRGGVDTTVDAAITAADMARAILNVVKLRGET